VEKINTFNITKKIEFSDNFKLESIIPLETNNKSIIRNLIKIYIGDRNIFVLDDYKRILIFNKEGIFQKSISHIGQGPGEWIEIVDFSLNSTENTIILRSQFKEYKYNINDELIDVTRINIPAMEYYCIDSITTAFYLDNLVIKQCKIDEDFFNLIVVKENVNSQLYCKSLKSLKGHSFRKEYYRNFCQTKKNVYLVEAFNDTIYFLNERGFFSPKYKIDFGKESYPFNEIKNINDVYEFNKNYAYLISDIYENQDVFLFEYIVNEFPIQIMYLKERGIVLRGKFNKDTLNSLPVNIINYYGNVDKVLSIIEPSEYLENFKSKRNSKNENVELLTKLKNIRETDNPVLIFYSIITKII
jgi:hypothetical protein